MVRRLLLACCLLAALSGGTGGCLTSAVWHEAARPSQRSAALGSQTTADGRDTVFFRIEDCPGRPDGTFAFSLPAGWRDAPLAASPWGRDFPAVPGPVLEARPVEGEVWESELAPVLVLSFEAAGADWRGRLPPDFDASALGVVYAPGPDGFGAELFGFRADLGRWVHLGRAPMDPPRRQAGNLIGAAALTPFTLCFDAAIALLLVVVTAATKGLVPADALLTADNPFLDDRPDRCRIQRRVSDLMERLATPARGRAAADLRALGRDAMPAVPLLRALASDPDAWVRFEAAATLWALCPGDTDFSLPALTQALRDGEPALRRSAACRIGALRIAPAVPALAAALADPDEEVRAVAARALGRMGSLSLPAVGALRQALADGSERVRRAADAALWAIPGEWPVGGARESAGGTRAGRSE